MGKTAKCLVQIEDNLSATDKVAGSNASIIQRFHCLVCPL